MRSDSTETRNLYMYIFRILLIIVLNVSQDLKANVVEDMSMYIIYVTRGAARRSRQEMNLIGLH